MPDYNDPIQQAQHEILDLHAKEDQYVQQYLIPLYLNKTQELIEINKIKELMEDVLNCCWYNLPPLEQIQLSVAKQLVQIVINCENWHIRLGYKNEWLPAMNYAYHICQEYDLTDKIGTVETLIAQYHWSNYQIEEALQWTQQAIKSTRASREILSLVKATDQAVEIFLYLHRPQDAVDLIDEISTIVDESMVRANFLLNIQRIRLLRRLGQVTDAIHLIEFWDDHAVDSLTQISIQEKISWYHISGLTLCWGASEYQKAISKFQNTKALLLKAKDYVESLHITCDIGIAYWAMGDLLKAWDSLYEVYEQTQKYNLSSLRMVTAGNMGLVKIAERDFETALSLILEHRELLNYYPQAGEVIRASGNLGIVHMHRGEFAEAIYCLEQAIAQTGINNTASVSAYIALSRCYNKQNNRAKAQELAQKALNFARKIDTPSEIIKALRILGECSSAEVAVPLFREALELAKGRKYMDEAACYLWLAHFTDSDEEQTTLWNTGRRILERIGADAWLDGHAPQNPPFMPPP